MKRILLCTDGAYSQVSYEYAAWIAKKTDVSLEVLYITDTRGKEAATSNFSGSIGIDSDRQLLKQLVEVKASKAKINNKRAKIILQEAKQFFSDRQIHNLKLTHKTGFLVDLFHELEQSSELIILGKRGENANFATEHLGANMKRIVRSSHKPCFVSPKLFQPVQRVLLAYDGGKSCKKVLYYLSTSPVYRDLELHLVTVDTGNSNQGEECLNAALRKLEQANYTPIVTRTPP